MKFINIKSVLVASLLVGGFTSCEEEDDYSGVRDPKSLVSVDTKAVTVVEGNTVTFTLTIDRPISKDIDFKLEYVSGTGGFRDYESSGDETTLGESGFAQGSIGHKLIFPALATTATFTITPTVDLLTEGTERIKLRLLPGSNALGLVSADSEFIDLTISDFASNDVGLSLEWGQDTTDIHGTISPGEYLGIDGKFHTYDLYDMDLLVFDGAGNEYTGFAAATGAPVEKATFLSSNPDGDYFVFVDQFGSPLPNPNPLLDTRPKVPFNKKMKVSLSKYGTWSTIVEVPFNSGSVYSDNVVYFTKVGNVYTVKDIVTNGVIVSGRHADVINKIRAKVKARRK